MKILMVLTSHDRLGDTEKKTGFWLEELASPYYAFVDAGYDVTLASPRGGKPPVDPKSDEAGAQTESTRRFTKDDAAKRALANTLPLSDVNGDDYDALFYPGGHGPLWDLADDARSAALIESMAAAGKTIAAVCHGPAVFRRARRADGKPFVSGKRVTGFTNSEEKAVQLTDVVPFLVEDELTRLGGVFQKGPDFAPFVQVDGLLVTGQNPASSAPAAEAVIELLER